MKKLIVFLLATFFVMSASLSHAEIASGDRLSKEEITEGVRNINAFFTLWTVTQDIDGAADYFAIRGTEYQGLLMQKFGLQDAREIDSWSRKMLVLLLADRTDTIVRAKKLGNRESDLYHELPSTAHGVPSLVRPTHWREYISIKSDILFGEAIIVDIALKNVPSGNISFCFEMVRGSWKITNFLLQTPLLPTDQN